jgi:uncharacterized repeat protein (TIGR03803 family)
MNSQSIGLLPCALLSALIVGAEPGTALAQAPEGTYRQLHSFTAAEGNASIGPFLSLLDGGFVGTASGGGEFDRGTVYVLKPGTHTVVVLHSFSGTSGDGAAPWSGVTADSDGNLWGTTPEGGLHFAGTIYRISKGKFKIVHEFGDDPGGFAPVAALTLASDGKLYGVTLQGGSGPSCGAVFRLDGDRITSLWDVGRTMGGPCTLGSRLLQASDGLLYGMSSYGGANGDGTIYSVALDGSQQRILHSFTFSDGYDGGGGLIEGTDGSLYGTTNAGGAHNLGVAFRIDREGNNFTVLHSFSGGRDDGANPSGELVETSPGVFVGSAVLGGKSDAGTIFQMLADGKVTLLHTFTGQLRSGGYIDGSRPAAALTRVGTDVLLGVTQDGGANGDGTVFKLRGN